MHVSDIPNITEMSVHEKIQLAGELWDSIALNELDVPIPQSHMNELDRRFSNYENNHDQLLSYDELKSQLVKRK
ncbi:MAG: addiction module protein [Nitrospirae bacterium]|nr:addiction module protein [Nitrospirota bacterium]